MPWRVSPARPGGPRRAFSTRRTRSRLAAFLANRIGFADIPAVVERTLEQVDGEPVESLEQVLEADSRARAAARALVMVVA